MIDSMFSVASFPSSAEDDEIRLRNLQREISDDVKKHIEQEIMAKRLSEALKEAFEESLNDHKESLELLLKDCV